MTLHHEAQLLAARTGLQAKACESWMKAIGIVSILELKDRWPTLSHGAAMETARNAIEAFILSTCRCGSGKQRYALMDAAGIFCTYVCEDCEEQKRSKYRAEIFDDHHPYASSGKEEDLEVDHDWRDQ